MWIEAQHTDQCGARQYFQAVGGARSSYRHPRPAPELEAVAASVKQPFLSCNSSRNPFCKILDVFDNCPSSHRLPHSGTGSEICARRFGGHEVPVALQRVYYRCDRRVQRDAELVIWMTANPRMVAEKAWMPMWRSPLLRYCLRRSRRKDIGKKRMPLVKELGYLTVIVIK